MKKVLLITFMAAVVLSCKKKDVETEEATIKCEVQMNSFPHKVETQRFVVLLNDVKVQTPSAFYAKSGDKIEAHVWNDYHPTTNTKLIIYTGIANFPVEITNTNGKPVSHTMYVP